MAKRWYQNAVEILFEPIVRTSMSETVSKTSMNSVTLHSVPPAIPQAVEGLLSYRVAILVTAVLLVSGCIHLALFLILGASWEGPLSPRKPALFGISGAMTTLSLAWLMTQLEPKKFDRVLINSLAIALLIEVALITMQYWRGVASHFNNSTLFDTAIELAMLVLILFVTGGIFYLTWRTFQLRAIEPAMAIAIRGGMLLLAISCLLGIATSVLGEVSLAKGQSSEVWRKAGVLKFPHGVALHAIQLLPILAWIARRLGLSHPVRVMQSALAAQVVFMIYAVWQTSLGRDRFDWDAIGGSILAIAILLSLYPAFELGRACLSFVRQKR